jgi:Tfp pilus assembly PilM family ATPase
MSFFDLFSFGHKKAPTEIYAIEELAQENSSLYLSFDKNTLKVVGGKKSKVAEGVFEWREVVDMRSLAQGEATYSTAAVLERAINDLKHRLEGLQDVSVSLPVESVFSQYISIPKNPNPNALLQAEMKKIIPLPFEEVMFAYNKVKETEKEESYFCIVIQKKIFDSYMKVFKNYGIAPYLELSFFSLARLCRAGLQIVLWIGEGESYIFLAKDAVVVDVKNISVTHGQMLAALVKEYDLSSEDALLLYNSFLYNNQQLQSETRDLVAKVIDSQMLSVAREISIATDIYKSIHGAILDTVYVAGLSSKYVNDAYKKISDKNMSFISLNFNAESLQIERYTQLLGLAKRSQ